MPDSDLRKGMQGLALRVQEGLGHGVVSLTAARMGYLLKAIDWRIEAAHAALLATRAELASVRAQRSDDRMRIAHLKEDAGGAQCLSMTRLFQRLKARVLNAERLQDGSWDEALRHRNAKSRSFGIKAETNQVVTRPI
ncbi:hypothetical protein ABIE89_004746 [Bradyrhizobium niftali]|uniref:hypothetical protein n=1 Tax=Bradyrhizobium niftali TaxID=2560055 RepID=UPI003834A27A